MKIEVYKMKKISLYLLCLALLTALLTSCNKGPEAPEGLVLLSAEDEAFTLYCPEGWSDVSAPYNASEKVYAARLTGTSKTSVTFVKADMPTDGVALTDEGTDPTLARIKVYFDNSLSALPEGIKSTLSVTLSPEATSFGNAPKAYKAIYTYKYESFDYELGDYAPTDFTCMQIFVINGEDFYIFTYNAHGTPAAEDTEGDYMKYLEKIQLSIDSFSFKEGGGRPASDPEYERDADGYCLVSDRRLAGFDLYLPESARVVASSGYVEARLGDGAGVSLSRATDTGVKVSDYWKLRKDNLSRIVENITELDVNIINKPATEDEPAPRRVVLGDLAENRVAAYEYTYDFGGKTYRVYQIMGVDSFNGYVFTYTAEADAFEEHLDEVNKILEKVRF